MKLDPVFTVYKTTCLVNGKIYIGVHKTSDPDDAYLGSGSLINRAVALYGVSSFQKDVLHTFATAEEAYAKEGELVDPEFIAREDTYNLILGGVLASGYYRDQAGSKNTQFGSRWICKAGEKPRKAGPEEIQSLLNGGWSLGRVLSRNPYKRPRKPPGAHHSVGRVNLHKDGCKGRMAKPSEVDALLAQGWSLGRSEETKQRVSASVARDHQGSAHPNWGRVQIYNIDLGLQRLTPPDQLEGFLADGWRRGMLPQLLSGRGSVW